MLDLSPATNRLSELVVGVRDDQLEAPTPCAHTTVGDLLDHVHGFSQAFTAAAAKTSLPDGSAGPSADAARLPADWRTLIPERLAALADAWRDQAAWDGMTKAGGQDLPGGVAGLVALDEVLVHGWDIAVATGQPYTCEADHVEAVQSFVAPLVAQNPQGTPGLFGPAVAVPDDAAPLDRLLGLTGRDPRWTPAGHPA